MQVVKVKRSMRAIASVGIVAVLMVKASILPVSATTRPAVGNAGPRTGPWRAIKSQVPLDAVACWSRGGCIALAGNRSELTWETLKRGHWTLSRQRAWSVPGNVNQIVCPAANRCLALGGYYDAHVETEILAYNHGKWSTRLPPLSPSVPPRGGATLDSVSCSSSALCVAVGAYTTSMKAPANACPPKNSCRTTIYHPILDVEKEGKWSSQRVPLPHGARPGHRADLESVSCSDSDYCVAVGAYAPSTTGRSQGLILILRDGRWSATRSPLPSSAGRDGEQEAHLLSVSCTHIGRCAAVGDFRNANQIRRVLIIAETHGLWRVRPVANEGASNDAALTSVSCRPDGDCAAIGPVGHICGPCYYYRGVVAGGSLMGDWVSRNLPIPPGNMPGGSIYIGAISCPTAGPCIGNVNYGTGTLFLNTAFLNYTNGRWRTFEGPLPASLPTDSYSASTSSPSCPAANWCVDVGQWTPMKGESFAGEARGFIDVGRP